MFAAVAIVNLLLSVICLGIVIYTDGDTDSRTFKWGPRFLFNAVFAGLVTLLLGVLSGAH